MNLFCNESVIRKAADWRAFKHGTELVSAVAEAAFTETGWRGAVRDGKRRLRVSVVARSATDFEIRCPCRENQATGAFCAHAVAVGLVLASEKRTLPQPSPLQTSSEPRRLPLIVNSTAWHIHLPPPWRRMLGQGKLAAKIATSIEAPDAADEPLTAWLNGIGAPQGGMLQLDGERLPTFLSAAVDHPRVVCEGVAVEITSNALLRIASVERQGERVIVTPEVAEIRAIGNLAAEITENRISIVAISLPVELRALSDGKPAELPLHSFLDLAESLGGILAWPDDGWLADLSFIAAKPEISITFSTSGRSLVARPLVRYGESPEVLPGSGRIPGLPELSGNICRMRDRQAEMQAVVALERHGFSRSKNDPVEWQIEDEARIADFLEESLQSFQSQFTIHYGPGLAKRIREVSMITPKFEIVGSGEDWLSFDLSFQTSDSGESVDSAAVWRMLKGTGGGKVKRVSRDLSEVIEPLFSELDLMQEDGRFTARGASVECVLQIHNYLNKTNNKNELSKNQFEIPASLCGDLRPYQLAGASWIWSRLHASHGALLADDMGLGKTIQTIAVIERLFEKTERGEMSILVVATTSLLGNWSAEFSKFAPTRRVRILHGRRRDSEKERVGVGEVLLTTFSTLARDLAWYLRQDFLAVVVDEASLMRNPDTGHAKALFRLHATHRIALSGTPVENGVRDLWSIFRFIQPGWLGGRREFRERYESPAGEGDSWGMRRLRIKTAPFMLRRTKEEVAPELPAKIIIDEFVDLSRDQQAVYRELLVEGRRGVERLISAGDRGAARMQVFTTLLRMRQVCCDLALLQSDRFKQLDIPKRSSKIERLLELINEAVSGNHKVLVFSQFKTQLHGILECLESRNIDCLQLDGSSRSRQDLVDRFQSPDGPPVFLISLKAGGYGLNLTAADVVIHFDPWWNPAAEAQATDRAHRIGQIRPVTVYRLLARGTVEEKVVSLQRRKRAVAAAIDEAGGGDAPGWSEAELAALLD
jgi:superfamily II DNA or RNA helicase